MKHERVAMDKDTVRSYDVDGKLHVAITPISKAVVNGYLGSEIPDGEELGLLPNKIYQLYRDPLELEKAAATFNNLPILSEHVPVSVDEMPVDLIIGSTGTDAVFDTPYLKNSIVVWTAQGIKDIESKDKVEISSAYRHKTLMEPGVIDGIAFDGRMFDIIGNHVAIVEVGRAGPDVIVADSELFMKKLSRRALAVKAAVTAYVRPKLAQDAKMPDIKSLLTEITASGFKGQKTKLVADLKKVLKPVVAQDIDLEDLKDVVEVLECDGDSTDETSMSMDSPMDQVLAMCKDKMSDEDMAKLTELLKSMSGNTDTTAAMDGEEVPKPDISKKAMDAAIEKAKRDTVASMTAIRQAEREVEPLVGEIVVAMDSAEAVYKFALEQKGEDLTDVHPSAYRTLVKHLSKDPVPTGTRVTQDHLDGAAALAKRFPNSSRLTIRS